MKRIFIISAVSILFLCSAALVPGKTKEKDIIGKWKFHMNISKAIDKETKDEKGWGAAFAKGIGHFVDAVVEEADITFDFQKDHTLIVTQDASWGDDDEEKIETYRWKLNRNGHVVTTPLNKRKQNFQDSDGWKLKGGKLIPVDDDEDLKNAEVWMERVDR
jgi:hypothetical protein